MYAPREWFAERWDPWPRRELATVREIDLGDIGEDDQGVRVRRHPQALLAEAPLWLHQLHALFLRSTERDLRMVDVEQLAAKAANAWLMMLGAHRRSTTPKPPPGSTDG